MMNRQVLRAPYPYNKQNEISIDIAACWDSSFRVSIGIIVIFIAYVLMLANTLGELWFTLGFLVL